MYIVFYQRIHCILTVVENTFSRTIQYSQCCKSVLLLTVGQQTKSGQFLGMSGRMSDGRLGCQTIAKTRLPLVLVLLTAHQQRNAPLL